MRADIAVLLLVVVTIDLAAGVPITGPADPAMRVYRVLHLLEMAALIVLVLRGFRLDTAVSRLIALGLVFSLGGDFINSFLVDLSHVIAPQTLLSIPPFVFAHLCYIAAFALLLNRAAERRPGRGAWLGLLIAWPMLALGLWKLLIDPAAPALLLKLSFGYACVVVLMGLVAVLLGARLGRVAWWPALGGIAFVLSDGLIGHFLLDGPARPLWASQAIWISYFSAQCLICQAAGLRLPPR